MSRAAPPPTFTTHAGVEVPQIVYGTAWKKDRTAALVTQALQAGFTGVDTACQPKHYHEPGVGQGINSARVPRGQLYVQTKFTPLGGHDPKRIPYDPAAPLAEQVAQSFAVSEANLGTLGGQPAPIDCLVLHSPLGDWGDFMAVWRAMEALHGAGRVRQLGLSNCYEPAVFERLFKAASIKPAVLQNRFYDATGFDKRLRAFARANGIVYQSFWSLTANPELLASAPITAAAAAHRRSPAQVLFRWLTQQGVCPLIGTTSLRHMLEDLAIFEFSLSSAQRAAIERAL